MEGGAQGVRLKLRVQRETFLGGRNSIHHFSLIEGPGQNKFTDSQEKA